MNFDDAKTIILADLEKEFGGGIRLNDDQIIEKPYGWVFFYNTKEFLETGDPAYALMSNTPFVFTNDGRKFPLRMSCTVEEAIAEIEREQSLEV